MPNYYFHLSFGERCVADEEGVELPNRAAAREEALAVVRDLSDRAVGRRWASWFLDVTDEQGSFLRLPIGHPALEILPKDGHRPQHDTPELEPIHQAEALASAPEGASENGPATLLRQGLAIRNRTAELLEHSNRLRDELSSEFRLTEQIRRRTRLLLSSARLVGWFKDSVAVAGNDGASPSQGASPQLVALPRVAR